MRFNGFIQTRDAAALHARRLRQQAYDDGYAKRPATSSLLIYQRSYLLGRKARVRDES